MNINFDVENKTGVQFETIMSIQQLATQLFQQDMMMGSPQGMVQDPQTSTPAGGTNNV